MTTTGARKKESCFKKIILHVGPGKTGSTSIQYFFDKNRKLLLENGVFYPQGRLNGSGSPGAINHQIFGSCFTAEADLLEYNSSNSREPPQLIVSRDRYYLLSLEKILQETQSDTLVFSYEGFVHLSEDALEKMKKFLESYSNEFEIVFYVRPPLSHAISAMSQRVKMGLRAFNDGFHVPFVNYQKLLGKFCHVFGKSQINVRLFSGESLPGGDVVLDFLSLLDLPEHLEDKIIAKGPNKNPSLSQEALMIGDKMAEILGGYLPPNEFNNKRKIGSVFLKSIKGNKIQLTALQQEEILGISAPHMEYLSKEFGIKMEELPGTRYKPLNLSKDTIDYLARHLLRILVPDFKQPIEASTRKKKELNRYFILSVMLTVKKFIFILATYYRFRSLTRWFIKNVGIR